MLAVFFWFCAALRAICHRAGGVEHQDGRSFAGVLLGLLQDDLKRDFVLVSVRSRFRGLGDSFNASRQRALVEGSLFPGRTFIVAIFDVATRTCSGSIPLSSQRYRREQADGQDQRQQQGYDSFHHFFFSPYVWFNFFVFFFRFSMCNGRGGRGLGGTEGGLGPLRRGRPLRRCAPAPLRKGSQGGVRRSQCLPLLRGGAERSEAERFRRVAAAGMTSQALRASSPSQGEPRGLQEFPSAVPAEGKKRVPSFGSSWGG